MKIITCDQARDRWKAGATADISKACAFGKMVQHRERFEHVANGKFRRRRRSGQVEQWVVLGDEIEMLGKAFDDLGAQIKTECRLMNTDRCNEFFPW